MDFKREIAEKAELSGYAVFFHGETCDLYDRENPICWKGISFSDALMFLNRGNTLTLYPGAKEMLEKCDLKKYDLYGYYGRARKTAVFLLKAKSGAGEPNNVKPWCVKCAGRGLYFDTFQEAADAFIQNVRRVSGRNRR